MNELSDENFWKKYWENVPLPSRVDLNFPFERCLDKFFSSRLAGLPKGSSVIEIGCAPGRWLAYFGEKFGLEASGIDFSHFGVEKTRENLAMLGANAEVTEADFFKYEPKKEFDIVVSLGFIEHFENQDEIFEKQLKLLKKGGLLIIGIPNFNGIYGLIQGAYDKEILDKHNLKIMNLEFFENMAKKYDLEVLECAYMGGFLPVLPVKPKKAGILKNIFIRAPLKLANFARKPKIFDSINHPFFSGYIICALRKRA